MSVYFIDLGTYVKVGFSENPERRCANLFASTTRYSKPWDCPTDPTARRLIGYVAGSKDDEQSAHRALDDFGVGCEFYLNEPELRDYIDRCLAAGRVLRTRVRRIAGPAEFVGQVEPDPDADERLRAVLDRYSLLMRGGAA